MNHRKKYTFIYDVTLYIDIIAICLYNHVLFSIEYWCPIIIFTPPKSKCITIIKNSYEMFLIIFNKNFFRY